MTDPTPPRMTDQAPELLPCPFCNSKVALSILEDEPGEIISAWVRCDCGVEISERPTEAETIIRWNTRPTPAERPVPLELEQRADAADMPATAEELEQMICIEFPSSIATRHAAERVYNFLYARISIRAKTLARRPTASGLPLREGQAEECDGGSRPVPQVREALEPFAKAAEQAAWPTFERDNCLVDASFGLRVRDLRKAREALTARPSDAAVAWRYRHKDTEGWLMLKNGRDPTEWLKQWTNTEYEVEALAPMRPEAAAERDKLRERLLKAQAAVNFCEWLNGYFGGINRRDELTALEANSIRAKLYGEVYPPAPLVVTDEQGGK